MKETCKKSPGFSTVFIWHGFFLALTMSMIDFHTVFPALVSQLVSSKLIFGLLYSIILGAPNLLNLLFSHWIQQKPYRKGLLLLGIYLRSFSFLGMAVFTYLFGKNHPQIATISFFFWIILFSLSGGFAGIAYSDIIGKLVPAGKRSGLYATREFFSGLAGLLGSLIVVRIFHTARLPYPVNYAVLLSIGFVGLLLASLAFLFIKEPPSPLKTDQNNFLDLVREIPNQLKSSFTLTRFIIVENMTGFSLMVMPFYMVYAKEVLKAGSVYIGRYLFLMVTGTILSNLLWGLIAKKRGSKAVVSKCILLGGLIPLLAIILTPLGPAYFMIIFLLLGFIQSGRDIGFDPYLLDFAPEELRTTYLGIRGSLNWLVVLLPILGGALINGLGYKITFTGVSLMMFIAYGLMGSKLTKAAPR